MLWLSVFLIPDLKKRHLIDILLSPEETHSVLPKFKKWLSGRAITATENPAASDCLLHHSLIIQVLCEYWTDMISFVIKLPSSRSCLSAFSPPVEAIASRMPKYQMRDYLAQIANRDFSLQALHHLMVIIKKYHITKIPNLTYPL